MRDAVCVIADIIRIVGGNEVADVLDHVNGSFETGLGFCGVRSGEDADDLAGEECVCVGSAGVHTLCINDFAVGFFVASSSAV